MHASPTFERNHAECHRDVIVEALQELHPGSP
jgi:hypothetical protein